MSQSDPGISKDNIHLVPTPPDEQEYESRSLRRQILPENMPAIALLSIFVALTILISNVLANTTTVIMILPFAINIADTYSLSPTPFIVAVTMAAGLSIMTPLSCGFIGMTMRAGYRFKDYIRYGWRIQLASMLMIIGLTPVIYPF